MMTALAVAALLASARTSTGQPATPPRAPTPQAAPRTASPVTVTSRPAAPRPGDVVRVDLTASEPIARVDAYALVKVWPFVIAADGRHATTLVAVSLDTRLGPHTIDIRGTTVRGGAVEAAHDLRIQKVVFPTDRLRVAPKFVEPSPDARERIARERARLGELANHVSRDRAWQAPFEPPLPTKLTAVFGTRRVFNGQMQSQHRGIDLDGKVGDPVAAPGAGRVALADDLYYTGGTVIIDHGHGVMSLLAHLSRTLVKEGQIVRRGEIVGEVGATGRVTGPHLHWTAWVGSVAVDPRSLLKALDAVSVEARPAPAR